ncbi:glucose 1-dehydrogenase [Nocardia sp. NBC_00508]|uniref:SDR family NAD(P)-dependent oxidoreductase n=1 Tax=Nocardia sp. NBC_00508 TaxID=2975992 RepID=UPI002E81EE97|nr:glucose 1-dehydrogenase [Nocardia sp. NBC_00508]WUD67095.1 glucose 1-dehydrogenase [Nocardia sp. NBC_00508]
MARLSGKTALITGGARGQGAAEARLFVAEGARVIIGDIRDDEGSALADELGAACSYIHHDVTDPDSWTRAVDHALDVSGRLDVLVNNAGIFRLTLIGKTSVDEYLDVIRVNQVGTFLGIQAAASVMRGSGGGSIINVSSVMGLRGGPGMLAYSASKFAIRGMTKAAALELAPAHIRVNSLHPGVIDTPMLADMLPTAGGAEQVGSRIPIGTVSQPEDVAPLALFLASDESRHCTGAEYIVDGGIVAGLGVGG